MQVFEDPTGLNYETDYTYNVLDDLLCVGQKGTNAGTFSTNCAANPASWRPRSFAYDSLSRLTSATNAESGTITYSYDPNGNLTSKTSPAPNQTGSATVTTTYSYDALNRLTHKSYSDTNTLAPTPPVGFSYDQSTVWGPIKNPIGRLTAMATGTVNTPESTGAEETATAIGAEDGFDYFGARYYASRLFRFMTPDRPFLDQQARNPKSWNLYSYVRDNPLNNTDPTGEACVSTNGGPYHDDNSGGQSCADAAKADQTVNGSVIVFSNAPAFWASDLEGLKKDYKRTQRLVGPLIGIFATLAATVDFGEFAFDAPPDWLNPFSIRFSQTSINDVDEIVDSMQLNGWQGAPIDVVKMPDGTLITLDNTRLFAAGEVGINVKANVHDAGDMISPERGQAFLERYGSRPSTWGDAARMRIGHQSAGYRNTYPNGSPVIGVNR